MVTGKRPLAGVFWRAFSAAAIILLGPACSMAATAEHHAVRNGRLVELRGACDASAAVLTDPTLFDEYLVWNDEKESTGRFRLDGTPLPVERFPAAHARNLQRQLRFQGASGEVDLEGAARLGDRLYIIGSHGRNSSGERRARREQLASVAVIQIGDAVSVTVEEGTRPYRDLVRHLAAIDVLRTHVGLERNADPDLAPEKSGISIEGLAAGLDDASLLLAFRNPLGTDGKAVVLRLRNPGGLVTTGSDPVIDPPMLLQLGGRAVRSIERAPSSMSAAYLVVGGPVGDGTDFALFTWSGVSGDDPVGVRGFVEATRGIADFRPEGLVIDPSGRRILLLSDDGGRSMSGRECKDLPEEEQRFRMLVLEFGVAP